MSNSYTPKLNLPKPGSGDTNWQDEYLALADMVDTIGDLMSFTVHYSGQVILNEIFGRRKFNQGVTIVAIDIDSRDIPAGANITIDSVLDSGSGFIEQSKIATLTAGSPFQQTVLTAFDVTNAQVYALKIKNVGTTNIGGELHITVHYQPKAIATI